MMSHFVVSFAVLVFASCAFVQTIFGEESAKFGSGSPLIRSKDDIEECKKRANATGKVYKDCYKMPKQTCRPFCMYEDGTKEQVNAVNKQLCCDIVGVMPTGTCKEGKCIPFGKEAAKGFFSGFM